MRIKITSGLALALLAGCTSGHAASGPSYGPAPASDPPASALLLGSVPPAAAAHVAEAAGAPSQSDDGVRVWLDGRRDLIRPHERVRVRVRTDRGAYLAVFHIDTNGDLDVLYPRSPDHDGWVDRGRTLVLGTRGGYDYLRVRGGAGMGYIFAVALDEPLELWRLGDWYRPRQAGWDPDRTIWGDPFYAMDELVRTVVPEWALGYESVDHYTYHVGRRYSYPRYACYDGYGDWYYSEISYWPSCDRVRIILGRRPYYYDTYRWHGSRRGYYERYYTPVVRTNRPLHGYKERTDAQAPPARAAERRPEPASRPAGAAPAGRGSRPAARGSAPESTRPARDGGRSEEGARERPTDTRSRPERGAAPAGRGSYDRPARGSAAPRDREQPRESPPPRERVPSRRESPPQREAAPSRRESPPQRESAPREEPRRESAPRTEPRRESAPRSRPAESAPRARPAEDRSRSAPPARRPEEEEIGAQAMLIEQQQQQDRPVETNRERPTFQRRGSQEPRAAQPRRETQPRREAPARREAPPQRETRPSEDSSRSRPSEPASRPPEG